MFTWYEIRTHNTPLTTLVVNKWMDRFSLLSARFAPAEQQAHNPGHHLFCLAHVSLLWYSPPLLVTLVCNTWYGGIAPGKSIITPPFLLLTHAGQGKQLVSRYRYRVPGYPSLFSGILIPLVLPPRTHAILALFASEKRILTLRTHAGKASSWYRGIDTRGYLAAYPSQATLTQHPCSQMVDGATERGHLIISLPQVATSSRPKTNRG